MVEDKVKVALWVKVVQDQDLQRHHQEGFPFLPLLHHAKEVVEDKVMS